MINNDLNKKIFEAVRSALNERIYALKEDIELDPDIEKMKEELIKNLSKVLDDLENSKMTPYQALIDVRFFEADCTDFLDFLWDSLNISKETCKKIEEKYLKSENADALESIIIKILEKEEYMNIVMREAVRIALDNRVDELRTEANDLENDLIDLREEMREERRAKEPDLDEIERLSYEIDTCREELLEINGILDPLSEVLEGLENESISAYKAILDAIFYQDDCTEFLDYLWESLKELISISKEDWKKIETASLKFKNPDTFEARIVDILEEKGDLQNE